MNQTITLLVLQHVFGCPIVYEKKNPAKLYKLEADHHDKLMVSPISGGTDSVILNSVDCVTSETVDFTQFLAELSRNPLGINSESTRNLLGNNSELNRNLLGIDPDDAPEYLGKTNYLFPVLHKKQPVYLKQLCKDIEGLLHTKITNSSKHESLTSSKNQYNEYSDILQAQTPNMLNDLQALKTKLITDIKKQKQGRETQVQTTERKSTYKKIIGIFVTIGIAALIFFAAWFFVSPSSYSAADSEESFTEFERKADSIDVSKSNITKTSEGQKWSKSKIERLIDLYQGEQKKVAFKFTREKIYGEIKGKTLTDYEVRLIIEKYLNKIKK